jgi:hypothetical protein
MLSWKEIGLIALALIVGIAVLYLLKLAITIGLSMIN